ncbi:MAG: hypothetical protein JST90_03555 [Bacteroidetes bacterium]|nr:hypothetical protein [Bacteroidota bacterium]
MAFFDRIKSMLSGKESDTSVGDKMIKSQEDVSPARPVYLSYYLFGHSIDRPLWHWDEWQHFLTPLQHIVDLSPDIPGIRSTQKTKQKASLSFGSMKWSRENNQKWATKYVDEEGWEFYGTEIAYPTRSACEKKNLATGILIIVENEALAGKRDRYMDQSVTIHISAALVPEETEPAIDEAVCQIGALMHQKLMGKMKRPDCFPSPYGMGYTDSLWDGARGVFDLGTNDFSDRFRMYGIRPLI